MNHLFHQVVLCKVQFFLFSCVVKYHLILHHKLPCNTTPYHTIPYHTILHYVISYHIISYLVTTYHIASYRDNTLLYIPLHLYHTLLLSSHLLLPSKSLTRLPSSQYREGNTPYTPFHSLKKVSEYSLPLLLLWWTDPPHI